MIKLFTSFLFFFSLHGVFSAAPSLTQLINSPYLIVNQCGSPNYIGEVTSGESVTVTFDHPSCQAYAAPLSTSTCSPDSLTQTFIPSGTSFYLRILCTEQRDVNITVTRSTSETATAQLRVLDAIIPSYPQPWVMQDRVCHPFVVGFTALPFPGVALNMQLVPLYQALCAVYDDVSCLTMSASTLRLVANATSGTTTKTFYVMCSTSSSSKSFAMYPDPTVMFDNNLYPDSEIVSLRNLFVTSDIRQISTYQCSPPVVVHINPTLTSDISLRILISDGMSCFLFADSNCHQPLTDNNLPLLAGSSLAKFYFRCSSAGVLSFATQLYPNFVNSSEIAVLDAGVGFAWVKRSIVESSKLPGQANNLTLTLQPSLTLAAGSVLVVGGLVNSSTSSSNLTLSGSDAAVFGSLANWNQVTGELTLLVAAGSSLLAGRDAVIGFTLVNPMATQTTIAYLHVLNNPSASSFKQPLPSIFQADGGFSIRRISSSNSLPNEATQVTLTLRPRATVVGPAVIEITQLNGLIYDLTSLAGPNSHKFFIQSVASVSTSRSVSAGSLQLGLSEGFTLSADVDTVLYLNCMNTRSSIAEQSPFISLVSATSKGEVEMFETSYVISDSDYFSSFSIQESSLLPSASNRIRLVFMTALSVPARSFSVKFSSNLTDLDSVVTLVVEAIAVESTSAAYTNITAFYDPVDHILVFTTLTAIPIYWNVAFSFYVTNPPVPSPGVTAVYSAAGFKWFPATGSILTASGFSAPEFDCVPVNTILRSSTVTTIALYIYIRTSELLTNEGALSIGSFNWITPDLLSYVSVEAFDIGLFGIFDQTKQRFELRSYGGPFWFYPNTSYIFILNLPPPTSAVSLPCQLYMGDTLLSTSTHEMKFNDVYNFTTARVDESNRLPNQPNVLKFTLASRTSLAAGKVIIIRGLINTQTPSNPALSLTDPDGKFGGVGNWNQETGTLRLTVASGKTISSVSFSLTVLNPATPQTPIVPEISVEGTTTWQSLPSFVLAANGVCSEASYTVTMKAPGIYYFEVTLNCPYNMFFNSISFYGFSNSTQANTDFPISSDPLFCSSAKFTSGTVSCSSHGTYGRFLSGQPTVFTFPLPFTDRSRWSTLTATVSQSVKIPLTDRTAIFDILYVTESNTLPTASNTLTITLRLLMGMQAEESIILTGLLNSGTASTSSLSVFGSDAAIFGSFASFDQSTGTLNFTIAAGQSIPAYTQIQIQVTLVNPQVALSSQKIQFSANGLDWISLPPFFLSDGGFSKRELVPVYRAASSFSIQYFMKLVPRANLPFGTLITIAGLDCSSTQASTLTVSNWPATFVSTTTRTILPWNPSDGTVSFAIKSAMSAGTTYTLFFPDLEFHPNCSLNITLGTRNPAEGFTEPESSQPVVFTDYIYFPHRTFRLDGSFVSKTLTLEFQPSVTLSAGQTVVITGLSTFSSSLAFSPSSSFSLLGSDAVMFDNFIYYSAEEDSLSLTIASGFSLSSSSIATVSLQLAIDSLDLEYVVRLMISVEGRFPEPMHYTPSPFAIKYLNKSAITEEQSHLLFTIQPSQLFETPINVTIGDFFGSASEDVQVDLLTSDTLALASSAWNQPAGSLELQFSYIYTSQLSQFAFNLLIPVNVSILGRLTLSTENFGSSVAQVIDEGIAEELISSSSSSSSMDESSSSSFVSSSSQWDVSSSDQSPLSSSSSDVTQDSSSFAVASSSSRMDTSSSSSFFDLSSSNQQSSSLLPSSSSSSSSFSSESDASSSSSSSSSSSPSETIAIPCPPSYYCPSESLMIQCPAGSYCPANVTAPLACSCCPAMSQQALDCNHIEEDGDDDMKNNLGVGLGIGLAIIVLVTCLWCSCFRKSQTQTDQHPPSPAVEMTAGTRV